MNSPIIAIYSCLLRSLQENHRHLGQPPQRDCSPSPEASMVVPWFPLPLISIDTSITPANCLRKSHNQISNFARQVFKATPKLLCKLVNKSMSNHKFITFEQGWETLHKAITKFHRFLEGLEPDFTLEEYIKLYTTVYELCIQEYTVSRDYARELYDKYRETCEEYIISKVLPSLQEKKGDILLRELLRRWSNYKVMTNHLSYIFDYLDQYIRRHGLASLEEINFSSFNHGVYEKMNKEIMDAIFSMIEQKLAGEKIEHTFVVHTLDFYIEFYKSTKKDKTEPCESVGKDLSKKINLRSSDGTVFEIDYGVALMSKRFEDITETISVGDEVDDISVHKVSSKILTMIVEYCKKHRSCYEPMEGDAKFVEVDPKTLLDLTTCACYMKIESLEKLTWNKVCDLIKGKTPEEIAQIFGDVDGTKLVEENIQGIESLEM